MSFPVSGVVLAGGQGRRMGEADKGLQQLDGRPLAAWVVERLAPQVAELRINANRNHERYAALGYPVFDDRLASGADAPPSGFLPAAAETFAGPLAGLYAALASARHPWLVSAPCDSPFLPGDLVARLQAGLAGSPARMAVARAGGRLHPVFSLCHRDLLPALAAYLTDGGRRVGEWCARAGAVTVDFPDGAAFRNVNTLDDLARYAAGGDSRAASRP